MTGYESKKAMAQAKVEGPLHVVCQCDKCKAQPAQELWAGVDFDAWWDTQPRLNETNPCSVDSFEYWAWEGWHAALAQEKNNAA